MQKEERQVFIQTFKEAQIMLEGASVVGPVFKVTPLESKSQTGVTLALFFLMTVE